MAKGAGPVAAEMMTSRIGKETIEAFKKAASSDAD